MTQTAAVTEKTESPLYFHSQLGAYECLGCGEMLEVPRMAMLKIDGTIQRVTVRNNAENLMLWRELHELDHAACAGFKDEAKAKDHRENRRTPLMKYGKHRA